MKKNVVDVVKSCGRELTKSERAMIVVLEMHLRGHNHDNPIKSPQLIKQVNAYLSEKHMKMKIDARTMRKLTHFIRVHSILPLIGNEYGYFVTRSKIVLRAQIKSLNTRAESALNGAKGLEEFLK